MHGGFPSTLVGWILFALTLFSTGVTAMMAANLILSGLGRRPYQKGDIALTYVLAITVLVSTALLISVDPNV